MLKTKLYCVAAFTLAAALAYCQPGQLVSEFADGGIFRESTTEREYFNDIAYLEDGTIIVSGTSSNSLSYQGIAMRLSATGEVLWKLQSDQMDIGENSSFNYLEVVGNAIYFAGTYLDSNSQKFVSKIVKTDLNGIVDQTFGNLGASVIKYSTSIYPENIVADKAGNLLVIMQASTGGKAVIIKLNAAGEIDQSYGEDGFNLQSYKTHETVLQGAQIIGDYLYAYGAYTGSGFSDPFYGNGVIMKFSETGERVASFGVDGALAMEFDANTRLIDIDQFGDGSLLFLTSTTGTAETYKAFVHKVDLNGATDTDFGQGGTLEYSFGASAYVSDIAVAKDLGIYITGRLIDSEQLLVAKLTSNGDRDALFGNDGRSLFSMTGLSIPSTATVLPNGNLAIAGQVYVNNVPDYLVVLVEGTPPQCSPQVTNIDLSECTSVTYNNISYTNSGQFKLNYTSAAGCDSTVVLDVVIYEPSSETITENICEPITINEETFSVSGSFTQILENNQGCDSTLTINIIGHDVSAEITLQDEQLRISGEASENIQWYDCTLGLAIEGENGESFTPTASGSYAVIFSNEFCHDTSSCMSVEILSSTFSVQTINHLVAYPNPTSSDIYIDKPQNSPISLLQVFNIRGDAIDFTYEEVSDQIRIDVSILPSGLYFVHFQFDDAIRYNARLMKI